MSFTLYMYLISLEGWIPKSVLNNVIVVCIGVFFFTEANSRVCDFIHSPTYDVLCYVGIGSGRLGIRSSRDRQGEIKVETFVRWRRQQ